ncbi:hypothetical protein LMG33818_000216 [Halomonadaceae bacterium LMG 33818]|uniref:hypothetical protein n=1 Tax=Cernens ardua TaxID=3402176 RepID=UPI003EDC014A
MFLLACSVLSLALFIYAGMTAFKMISIMNKPAFQRNDSDVVYLGWKAAGLILCGVIVIVAGMLMG